MSDLRSRIADEISSIQVGSGYESTTIGITAALEAADALIAAGVVAEEPEWETEEIQYGHLLEGGIFIVEHRGKNYSTHQRRIKLGRPESSWVVDESAAPWARRDGCFAHCDPEGWFAPCQMPVKQEGTEQ